MIIDSTILGARLKPFETTVNYRMITNYAAAVRDMNSYYVNDIMYEPLIAHPMFVAAISWPIFQNLYDYLSVPYPKEVFQTVMHYTEDVSYFKPLSPGLKLVVDGEVIAVLPAKTGTKLVFRLEARDERANLYYTEDLGAFLRGVSLSDKGGGYDHLSYVPECDQDFVLWDKEIYIREEDPYIYDGCTDIVFPIHTSPKFAKMVKLPKIVYQGSAILAHAVREIINMEASGDPNRITKLSAKFSNMVLPDTHINIQSLGSKNDNQEKHCWFRVLNSEGKEAISKGYALIKE